MIYRLIDSLTETRQFGILGNEVVNILALNIKLDELIK
jgi:K+-transporting ATPase c subunit